MPIPASFRPLLRTSCKAGLLLLAASGTAIHAQVASASDGFAPNPNGVVNAVVLQPDGHVLVGGLFTQLQPNGGGSVGASYLARLNHDGSFDSSLSAGLNGVVDSIALQANGQILAGGAFTSAQPAGAPAAYVRSHLVRYNANGSLDLNFFPIVNGTVYAIAVQSNGQILIGGNFTSVQGTNASAAVARGRIARLNADGTLDTTFNPDASAAVLAIAIQTNGQIIIGGGFATLQPNGASSPSTYNCIARLNTDGSVDSTFNPNASGSVNAIVIQTNGQILIGGGFTSLTPLQAGGNTTQVDFFARLNTDGSLDMNYIVDPLTNVSAIALQADGKVLIGGAFTAVYPVNATGQENASFVARINADGSLDTSFSPNPNQAVNAIAVQPDGDIILGGLFSALQPNAAPASTARNCLARVGTDASLDATLAPDTLGRIFTAAVQPNGQIVIGGTFVSIGGVTRNYIARLNANGSLDQTFNPIVNGAVAAIAILPNGQMVIGGSFTDVDTVPLNYVALLNSNGSVVGAYNPDPNGTVTSLLLLSNGQMLIGGNFSTLTPNGSTITTERGFIARLNSDGSLDPNFDPETNGTVYAITLQSNGQILIGGSFTSVTPAGAQFQSGRNFVARLNSDGTLDPTSFNPNANGNVYAIVEQSNGQIILGGNFTSLEPATSNTNTTATSPTTLNYIARVNNDGTIDTTYNPNANGSVLSLALLPNGEVLAAGNFTSFQPNATGASTGANYIAELTTSGAVDPGFAVSANGQASLITPLSSGEILVAGAFTAVQPTGGSAVNLNHLAFLNTNGSVVGTFTIGSGTGGSGSVYAAAVQPDGGILIAGAFPDIAGSSSSNLARFNSDGTTDTNFNPNADGSVNTAVVLENGAATASATSYGAWLNAGGSLRYPISSQANGQILAVAQLANGQLLIGGSFSNLQNYPINNIARINTDGSIDTTFNPNPNAEVQSILVLPNGQILIGGDFTQIGPTTINYVARLNSNGTLDSTFNPNPDSAVTVMALQSNGQILIGGAFNTVQPNGAATATTREDIARLNSDGSVDTGFNPNPNGGINAIAFDSSGNILIGGVFTSFQPNATGADVPMYYVARLSSAGALDMTFDPNPDAQVNALVIQSNGQIVIGGNFTTLQPNATVANPGPNLTAKFLVRVNSNGTLDTTYAPTPNGAVNALAILANGQVLAGGSFTTLDPNSIVNPITRNNMARVNTNGTVDPSFDPDTNGSVSVIQTLADNSIFIGGAFTSVQAGGAFLVGGSFSNIGSALSPFLARLNFDGSADTSFTSTANGPVDVIAPEPNGQFVVGGTFTTIGGMAVNNLARLNADGSLDTSFNPSANGAVDTAAAQASGAILLGGSFTNVGGLSQAYLARLGATGAPDATFTPLLNGPVASVVVLPNGQIVIGGSFSSVSGAAVKYLARLNSNGSVDTTFNPGPNGPVTALTTQADGTLLVGGSFTSIAGEPFAYAARLTSSGSADTTFNPGVNGPVAAIAAQPDAKVILGGSFTAVGGQPRFQFARISAIVSATQSLTMSPDTTTLTWTRGGGTPELITVEVEESQDTVHWVTLGEAARVGSTSTWQVSGLPPPGVSTFYARVRGVAPAAQYGSASLLETVQSFYIVAAPVIPASPAILGTVGSPFTYQVVATNSPTSFGASGLPAGLTINGLTGLISGTPTQAGTFTVAVAAANSGGTSGGTLTLTINSSGSTGFTPLPNSLSNRLIDVSTLAALKGTQTQFLGFVISGTGSKAVLLRAVGPGLAGYGVPNPVGAPLLRLYSGATGALLAQNQGWGGNSAIAATMAQVGAFPLSPSSADCAIVTSLAPGSYTIEVTDSAGIGGSVLSEVYDAAPAPLTATQRIADLSSRGPIGSGAGTLVAGFVIGGSSNKSVLIRGVGPDLANYGVTDAVPNPVLQVYTLSGTLVAENFSWGTQESVSALQPSVGPADIVAAENSAGAYVLPTGSADTALIANLPPGAYTVQVSSATDAVGEVLAEVYELP